MDSRLERTSVWTGIAAIVLWVLGLVVMNGMSDSLSDKATDPQILAWVDGNTSTILLGGWLFMLGCLCFIWFAAVLRSRLLAAEGGSGMLATLAFAGAIVTAVFGLGIPAGDVDAAINKTDISATTAGTLHHLGDLFFVGAELGAIVMLAAVAVLTFRTAVLPRWWGIAGALLAVVLVIGPIGWIGLLFGLPLWTLGTTILLVRPGTRAAPAPAVG
jgi:hypothetical protein